ncbi:hypothetical protein SDC9_93468 [bioreactor metagenome]|uniref:Zinc-ribbon domain-containing protein n=1 Tax=bioreactor metagenome TaxID=1076179 RepID=A0A645A145_9ZZZZ
MKLLICPTPDCSGLLYLEDLRCDTCGAEVAYHTLSETMVAVTGPDIEVANRLWHPCVNRDRDCNWLAADDSSTDQCFSCRLTRVRPNDNDPDALERLAEAEKSKRRVLVQLNSLGLPIDPYFESDGGLGFDLLSSEYEKVTIGQANGIVTIDLAETLDAHRERLRVALGEPYRTMLGHFRHEIGHYYEWVLVEQTDKIEQCRQIFGDERASYTDAIDQHYSNGAPPNWRDSYISEYATMHPWEDFAECFAHYLHITDTLDTAASAGMELVPGRSVVPALPLAVGPRDSYGADDFDALMDDWHWISLFFNRVNRSMGKADLYPFSISDPVVDKLRFIHGVLTDLPRTRVSELDGFGRSIDSQDTAD